MQVLRVLVGNKIDRDDHEIPGEVGEEFATRHGMYFLQVTRQRYPHGIMGRRFSDGGLLRYRK